MCAFAADVVMDIESSDSDESDEEHRGAQRELHIPTSSFGTPDLLSFLRSQCETRRRAHSVSKERNDVGSPDQERQGRGSSREEK